MAIKFFGSIESLYVRNNDTNKLDINGPLREESWKFITEWDFTEKVNGMNASIVLTHDGMELRGRTENTQWNQKHREGVFAALPSHEAFVEFFQLTEESAPIIFYGEAYGAGIQKGGYYRPDVSFRAFDLQFGPRWLSDDAFRGIAEALDVPTVPYLGRFPLPQPFDEETMRRIIPYSVVAAEDSGNLEVIPEGVVARPPTPLFDEYGRRVMFKMTNREYR